jgi:hypothetical protein
LSQTNQHYITLRHALTGWFVAKIQIKIATAMLWKIQFLNKDALTSRVLIGPTHK